MSVSKWKWTEACDSKPCCGNCDECSWECVEDKQEPVKDPFEGLTMKEKIDKAYEFLFGKADESED